MREITTNGIVAALHLQKNALTNVLLIVVIVIVAMLIAIVVESFFWV